MNKKILAIFISSALYLLVALTTTQTSSPKLADQFTESGTVKGDQASPVSHSSPLEEIESHFSQDPAPTVSSKSKLNQLKPPAPATEKQVGSKKTLPNERDKRQTISLLDDKVFLENEKLSLQVPAQSELLTGPWTLIIAVVLSTQESLQGFDRPGFTICFDENLVEALSAHQINQRMSLGKEEQTYRYVLPQLENFPKKVNIWAGDSGDLLWPTTALVERVELLPKISSVLEENLEKIRVTDLKVDEDQEYLTLSWTGTASCLSQIRYNQEPINSQSWLNSPQASVVSAFAQCPLIINQQNLFLIERPKLEKGYLSLVIVDQAEKLVFLSQPIKFGF